VSYDAASSLCCMMVTVTTVSASWPQHGVTLVLAARIPLAVGQEQFQPEHSNFMPWRRALCCRNVVAGARVRSRISLCDICGGQIGTGRGLPAGSSVFTFQYHAHDIFYLNFGATVTRMRNRPSLRTFQKAVLFLQWKALDRKYLITFSFTLRTALPQLSNLPGKHPVVSPVTDVSTISATQLRRFAVGCAMENLRLDLCALSCLTCTQTTHLNFSGTVSEPSTRMTRPTYRSTPRTLLNNLEYWLFV